jgi:S-(hydroxymethyl)glutathione dehydrogenase/alcohol dehydrogenase
VRAAVLTEFARPLQLLDVEIDDPAPDEVLVRVAAAGVCHSDLNVAVGNLPASPRPQVLGHEAAGTVERVGSAVRDVRPGDHVVTCPSGFCGTCRWCMSGLLHLCVDKRRARPSGQPPRLPVDVQPVAQFVGLGGFAEQMLVSERAVAVVPPEMPMDRAALLGCAVVSGMGTVFNAAQVRPGQTVAVIGCGGVGLNAIQAARFAGAAKIIAVDRLAAKLARARVFGATDVIDAAVDDPVAAVRELTGGGVDHALEVVGRPATITQAFEMLAVRGMATVVGVPKLDDQVTLRAMDLLSERRLQGVQMGASRFRLDLEWIARMYLDGRLLLDELISQRVGLEDVNDCLTGMDASTGARSVIVMQG